MNMIMCMLYLYACMYICVRIIVSEAPSSQACLKACPCRAPVVIHPDETLLPADDQRIAQLIAANLRDILIFPPESCLSA